jgi:hypothetical protein
MDHDQRSLSGIPDNAETKPSPSGEGDITDGNVRRSSAPARARNKTLSQILTDIAADPARDAIAISDLITLLGGRGRAGLILLFALPNVLPAPPGMSGVLGLPLLYLSFQMMLGRVPWLPRFIGHRSVPRDRFALLVDTAGPLLARAERLLRPRWSSLVNHGAERVIGAFCLLLAAVIALPIPLGNMLPALAISLIALGVLERDGLWVLIGTVTGLVSLFIVAGVVYALIKSTIFLLFNAFG